MGHDLVTETDAADRDLRIPKMSQKSGHRPHPRHLVVNAVTATRDHVAIETLRLGQVGPGMNRHPVPCRIGHCRGHPRFEHVREIAVLRLHFIGGDIGFKYTDSHGYTWAFWVRSRRVNTTEMRIRISDINKIIVATALAFGVTPRRMVE